MQRFLLLAGLCGLSIACLAASGLSQCELNRLVGQGAPSYFGYAVDMRNETALVGGNGGAGESLARFFERSGPDWIEVHAFALGDVFLLGGGVDVTLGQDVAIVGNVGAGAPARGSASVFERASGVWAPTQVLVPSDAADFDQFGQAVALAGDTLVVTALHTYSSSNFSDGLGAAYVFTRGASGWSETHKLVPAGAVALVDNQFGRACDVDGDRVVVGAPGTNGQGRVHVFERGPGGWSEVGTIAPADAGFKGFGASLDLEGDRLLVGAPHDDGLGLRAGAAYVFERDASGWTQIQKLQASDGSADDYFGTSVALSPSRAVVGAFLAQTGAGAAYVFMRQGSTWTEIGLRGGDGGSANQGGFGIDVAINGNRGLVGACLEGNLTGAAYELHLSPSAAATYCSASPNGTGFIATLSTVGCDSLQANELRLEAGPVPAGVRGVFFYGTQPALVPFGNGVLCVEPPVQRLVAVNAGASGVLRYELDFTRPPGRALTTGTSWFVQAFFRDTSAYAGFGLSNGLIFTPAP